MYNESTKKLGQNASCSVEYSYLLSNKDIKGILEHPDFTELEDAADYEILLRTLRPKKGAKKGGSEKGNLYFRALVTIQGPSPAHGQIDPEVEIVSIEETSSGRKTVHIIFTGC